MLHIAYDETLLGWKLGKGHPTNPIRAKNATELLVKRLGNDVQVDAITREATLDELTLMHAPDYVAETLAGFNSEWAGQRRDLGRGAIASARHDSRASEGDGGAIVRASHGIACSRFITSRIVVSNAAGSAAMSTSIASSGGSSVANWLARSVAGM